MVYEYPHVRNYDSDQGYIIKKVKELLAVYETMSDTYATILTNITTETQNLFTELVEGGGLQAYTSSYVEAKYYDTIQDAIEYAYANGVKKVLLEGKTYTLTTTLQLYSGMTLEGVLGATILSLTGVDAPIVAHKGTIAGFTHLKNFTVTGDTTKAQNTGVVLNDYYSMVENVKVINVGGYGIQIDSTGASGTLVENKIIGCTVTNAMNTSFMLGTDDNGKITDGFLVNCISYGSGGNLAVQIGSSAGWLVEGLHVYGHGNASIPIYLRASYNTIVNNVYIEGFGNYAMQLGACQLNVIVNNFNALVNSTGAVGVITMDKSGAFGFDCNVCLTNINVMNSTKDGLDVLTGVAYGIQGKARNINVSGTYASTTYPIASGMAGYILSSDLVGLSQELSDVSGILVHGSEKVAKSGTGKYTGAGAQTFNFQLNDLPAYAKVAGRLMVHSCSWDDGVGRAVCVQEVFISKKLTSGKVSVFDVVTAGGFSVAPAVSYNASTDVVTVTFTDSSSDATGICAFEYTVAIA